jgi:hypothetical protein
VAQERVRVLFVQRQLMSKIYPAAVGVQINNLNGNRSFAFSRWRHRSH